MSTWLFRLNPVNPSVCLDCTEVNSALSHIGPDFQTGLQFWIELKADPLPHLALSDDYQTVKTCQLPVQPCLVVLDCTPSVKTLSCLYPWQTADLSS